MKPQSLCPGMMFKSVVFATFLFLNKSYAFTSILNSLNRSHLYLTPSPESNNSDDNASNYIDNKSESSSEKNNEQELITKDMFYRDMLADPDLTTTPPNSATVKRKKKNGSTRYRTLDNRDNLPFLVKVTTPDPYTSNDEMERTARKNTKRDREQQKEINKKKTQSSGGGGSNNNKKKKIRKNMIGMDGKDAISSSIYTRHDDGTLQQILGEFTLDKSTNNGDIIQVGGDGEEGREYQVQKSRCQYKYAGGKRFVMVRKILEVKEIKRVLVEQEIQQIFDMDADSGTEVTSSIGNDDE